jgi:hypothetical protein
MKQSPTTKLVILALRVATVAVIAWVGWTIYEGLPASGRPPNLKAGTGRGTQLHLQLRPGGPIHRLDLPVRVFPLDIYSAQREFNSEPHPGQSWADFLTAKMAGRIAVEGQFDKEGRVTLRLSPGTWWINVAAPGEVGLEWLLRVDVSGSEQTLELNEHNILTRTKSF